MIPNQNILPGRSRWANYLAVVTPFQTLTPLPKCCFKNAKVRSRANSATYWRSAELSA
ncbi:MAG: hypothetical protein ACYTXT_31515 [Nostoc sp.]